MFRLRHVLPLLALPLAGLAAPVGAETLADIKVELGQLSAEFNKLKAELTTTGASARVGGSDALARMDAIEAELMRVTAKAEEIELRLNRVVNDGTNRIGDMEFRLCEATPGCDPLNMSATAPLGGGSSGGSSAAAPAKPATKPSEKPQLAMSEQQDFDRAKEVLGQGDFRQAATLFEAYAQSFPGGPLIQEAHLRRGEALEKLGEGAPAARAYLEAYSSDPAGSFAADALLALGRSLGNLGQKEDGCMTLQQVSVQYPGSAAAAQAPSALQALGCP